MTNQKTPVQGVSTEEQIEAVTWALTDSDTDVADRGVSDEHYRERRAEVERIAPILALSAATSAHPADEHHDAEEREAESEDHAATVTGEREKLIANLARVSGALEDYEFEDHASEAAGLMKAAADALAAPVEVDTRKLAAVRDYGFQTGDGVGASSKVERDAVNPWLRGEGR